ncbi:MAG TPA: hypothetical protein RMH80_16655, partial [Polyangiaceae bacterium LLY-WYZ-15_(1-7)]|nr:hypothetical protein [Polyangiaceae bacterium LLY-WYZ-15_(1-7)]
HGFAATPAVWDPVVAELDGVAVACPRILGHGGDAAGVERFDDEVDRLAAELAPEAPWVLGGYSLGGRLALGLLVRHAELFERAVLLGAHPGLQDEGARATRRHADAERARRLEGEGLEAFLAAWDAQPLFERRPTPPREGLEAAGLARALRVLGLGAMPSRWGDLAQIAVPTDYAVGAEDLKFRGLLPRLRNAWPAVETHVVPVADHDVVGCAPGAVAALLRGEPGHASLADASP